MILNIYFFSETNRHS